MGRNGKSWSKEGQRHRGQTVPGAQQEKLETGPLGELIDNSKDDDDKGGYHYPPIYPSARQALGKMGDFFEISRQTGVSEPSGSRQVERNYGTRRP